MKRRQGRTQVPCKRSTPTEPKFRRVVCNDQRCQAGVSKGRRAWNDWRARAMGSGRSPLKACARNLTKRIDGVLAQCRWKLNTLVLEGMNNKVKVLKRMAYGFRDDD